MKGRALGVKKEIKKKGVKKSVYLINRSTYEGTPPYLYRTPEEIRRDISDIRNKISDINNMLNIRNILTEMLSECRGEVSAEWIAALEEVVDDAKDAYDRLTQLNESLDGLTEELKQTKWILGI